MNSTQHVTLWGAVTAAGIAVLTYAATGGDYHSPAFWVGMTSAAAKAAEGYYSKGI